MRGHLSRFDAEELFFRAFRNDDFDVAELSFSSYLITTSRNVCPYIAIPAFVSRYFRHSAFISDGPQYPQTGRSER